MKLSLQKTACLFILMSCVGCGGSQPVNVKDSADEQSIEEYKAMVAEEEAANAGTEKNGMKPPKE
ncbi:hypothetical protein LOC71_20890 [Rhodopirellula sp. JC740]|uniref:Secreted protein n=1 Tax=Rhodopirellula halodulae TaxID=2894198 RepID=A0ABS8NMD1_9BACT|nr:hypothetical protein [Rhodopirellula sp. JC740]MCC9644738.1 hypothetical protein [Rhodopirellula sp. JC740]